MATRPVKPGARSTRRTRTTPDAAKPFTQRSARDGDATGKRQFAPKYRPDRDKGKRPFSQRSQRDSDEGKRPFSQRSQRDSDEGKRPFTPKFRPDRDKGKRPFSQRSQRDGDTADQRPSRPRSDGTAPRAFRPGPAEDRLVPDGFAPDAAGEPDASSADEGLICGLNPVAALLREGTAAITSLFLAKESRNPRLRVLVQQARERHADVKFLDRHALDRLAGATPHQGVVARIAPRPQPTWDALLAAVAASPAPLVILLDNLLDPHNLGAVMRSAEAFGALAVITTRDRSAPLGAAAQKAAAGAAQRLDLVRVTNLSRAIEDLREAGVLVLGLAGETSQPLHGFPLTGPLALVMGGEEKGLRRLTREKCTALAAIPLATGPGDGVGSLNVSVAAGVALYEVYRQRSQGQEGQEGEIVQADLPHRSPS
ncbi:MAG: 23S rRNA (guanosine(2251)-2'-O)-methyltransferase RlmB [Magnetococcales bacterium]|nr:23S rRNA (guanosine(2251)-2'-O)-methyltransferase RlmB [Magnetococcales bacterium]